MPSFLPRRPAITPSDELYLDVDAGRQMVEPLQRVDRLRCWLKDVDEPLVRADLEVLPRVLVLERRANHAVDVLLGRQGHGPGHRGAGAHGRVHDLLGGRLDRRVVVGLEPNADLVLGERCHMWTESGAGRAASTRVSRMRAALWACPPPRRSSVETPYSMISVTTPEPTVRPPSRIAKRRPSSMAMGWMSSTVISMLSPGMTISVPSGRFATPVTSVVRK